MSSPTGDSAAPVESRVELVDADGHSTGHAPVTEAHLAPARRHRAFSVLLHDANGHILLQVRSNDKQRWPGYLANSCCGHPGAEATVIDDARTRVREELGITVETLVEVGRFEYRAAMPDSRWEEWEYDHVLVGQIDPDTPIAPDPAEVAAYTWTDSVPDDVAPHAPWLPPVIDLAAEHIPGFRR